MKTAVNILYEHGICLLELNDEFNTSILKSMEEYKDQELASLRSELALKEKEIEVLKRAVKTLSQFLDEKGDQLKNTKPWKPI